MLNRFFGKDFHDHFQLFGLTAFAIGLPTSKVILSLSTMLLLLNVLLEADYKAYWTRLRSNRLFLIILSYCTLHILSLFWTSNFEYASNDLRIKLTLMVIPLVLTIKPLENERFRSMVLNFLVATLLVTSVVNLLCFLHVIGNKTYTDIRELSLFGSHIRYGLLISVGAGICLYNFRMQKNSSRWLFLIILLWFCFYTYYSQVISGFLAMLAVLVVFILFLAFERSRKIGIASLLVLFALVLFPATFVILQKAPVKKIEIDKLPLTTPSGNTYTHNLHWSTFIDGKPVLAFLCEEEIKQEWNKRSNIQYDSLDRKLQPIRFTLIRYMTSLNMKKDSVDFQRLKNEDIRHIENGIANIKETESGLLARWEGIKFQLNNSMNPNGHSMMQRLEYWKTAKSIILQNWLIGVGVGDVQDAFNTQYQKDHSLLTEENRLRAHNSYLTNWISFGLPGVLIFLVMIIYFTRVHWRSRSFIPVMFMVVAAVTFLLEDTLETQTGVAFFAFFYGFFSYSEKSSSEIKTS